MRSGWLLLLLLPLVTTAGGDRIPVGARMAGMGNASPTLYDLWSLRHNQAGLAALEKTAFGLAHQRHWMASELTLQALAFATPLGKGTIGASASIFGSDLYREESYGIAYAMRLGDGLRASVQMNYVGVRLGEGYGNAGAPVAELGVQARLTDPLWIGVHLYNPTQSQLGGPYNEKIPTVFNAGIGYTFSEKLLTTLAVEKDIDRRESVRAGIEYHPVNALFIRTGVSSGPTQAHFGMGLRFGQVDLDLAVSVRSQLGATPQFNLNYRFK
ncbi:MAG: hypothetical protein JNM31_09135 [Flavobacteriales bacterium]|nr:hypothetical protein [Flavobacteriales bacterium]